MVKMFASKFGGLVLAASLLVFASGHGLTSATAQTEEAAPVILIVDSQRVRATSAVGQSIAEQLKVIQDTANKELEDVIAKLNAEKVELQSKQSTIPEDDLRKEVQRLALLENNIPVLREIKVRELQATEQKAFLEVNKTLAPIVEEIVSERGATLLLERSAVLYHAEATDITDTVLTRLNEALDTIRVERVTVAAQQQAAAESSE